MKFEKSRIKRWIRRLFYGIGIAVFVVFLFFLLVLLGAFGQIPSREELLAHEQYKATEVFSSEGNLIGKIYVEDRSDLTLDELPDHVLNTLIVTEDVRFYEHEGVDYRSLFRVLVKSVLLDRDAGGGSTITQQLAKNMYGRKTYGFLTPLVSKTREIIIANRLEKVYDKEQILVLYLNQVPFGENIYGIESAAQRFFNKRAGDLKTEEGAVLIGMLQANTAYNPRMHPEKSRNRRNVVLRQLARYGHITDHVCDSLVLLPIELNYTNLDNNGPAAYFLVQVRREAENILDEINKQQHTDYNLKKDGLHIHTTLNTTAQDAALAAFRQHLSVMQRRLRDQYNRWGKRRLAALADQQLRKSGLQSREHEKSVHDYFSWDGNYTDTLSVRDSLELDMTMLHAGMIGLDPSSGAVNTWVGGIDFARWPYDQILAKRQLASTFKPIIYAAALEAGADPCDRLSNAGETFEDRDNESGWIPSNYDGSTGGSYSMNGALTLSMNIPTIQLYKATGYDQVMKVWTALGFKSQLPEGLSAALGTADASLMELAVAYAVFANGGYRVQPYMIESISTGDGEVIYQKKPPVKRRVLSKQTCAIMNHMLGNAVDHGTARSLRTVYGVQLPVSGKTGTSQSYSDAWFVACNPRIVMATRVGASSPKIHFNSRLGSGGRLALPLVGMTLSKVQYTSTGKKWNRHFPELSRDEMKALDCPDFKDDPLFQKWINSLMRSEVQHQDAEKRRAKREESIDNFLERVLKNLEGK